MSVIEANHDGELSKVHSFVSAEPDNIVLTVIKKAEDSDDTVLRLYETAGKDTYAVIHFAETLKDAKETDLLENETSEAPTTEKTLKTHIAKHEIKTIKIVT